VDWTAVGAIGELLGAAAVVMSLIYLGRQIHGSNRIARAEAYRSTKTRTSQLVANWASDPEWAELFVRIRFQQVSRKDLNARQRAMAGLHLQSLVLNFEAIHLDVQEGVLPASAYEILGFETFAMPYMQEVWPIIRNEFSEDFRRFFEDRFGLSATSDSIDELPPGSDRSLGASSSGQPVAT
jgi:hypothetical protein